MRLFTNLVTHEYEMLLNPISPGVKLSFPKRQTGGSRQIGQGGCQSCKTSSHKQEHLPTRASWKSISERSAVDLSSGIEIRNGWMARKPAWGYLELKALSTEVGSEISKCIERRETHWQVRVNLIHQQTFFTYSHYCSFSIEQLSLCSHCWYFIINMIDWKSFEPDGHLRSSIPGLLLVSVNFISRYILGFR